MNWWGEWKSLSARIQGHLDASRIYLECMKIRSTDDYSVGKKVLNPQSSEITQDLMKFQEKYGYLLPDLASSYLAKFLEEFKEHFNRPDQNEHGHIQFRVTALVSFQAEFSYLLSDASVIAKRLSERAFIHLQRTIVADPQEREKWLKAFGEKEPACEKLGGVHLLLHGIWGFKTGAEGERSDLILSSPFENFIEVENSAEALSSQNGSWFVKVRI